MYIKFFLSMLILSCTNKKADNISAFNPNNKHNNQLQIKTTKSKEDKGFLVLKNTYNQNNILTIYNLDKSKWKSFKFNDQFNDDDIAPNAIKPENTLLVFKCLGRENGFYKIVVNDEKNIFKYIKESDLNFKYQTIKEHILTVFSIDFNEEKNPLKSEPDDKAKQFSKNKNSFYYPIKINGNWLMVEDNKEKFWIKWCNENGALILDLYYDA